MIVASSPPGAPSPLLTNADGQNAAEYFTDVLALRKRERAALATRLSAEEDALAKQERERETELLVARCEESTVQRHRMGSWLEGQWALERARQEAREAAAREAARLREEARRRREESMEAEACLAASEVLAEVLADIERAVRTAPLAHGGGTGGKATAYLKKQYALPGLAPPARVFGHLAEKLRACGLLDNPEALHDLTITPSNERCCAFLQKPKKADPANWCIDTDLPEHVVGYASNSVDLVYVAEA